jgi:hypothetical protein
MFLQRLFRSPAPSTRHAEDLMASLLVMAWMVEARDPYTGGHLWRVSRYARMLSQAMDLPAEEVDRISIGGFLHDLGKIGIPDHILGKRDKLSDEEYEVIKTHPNTGVRMLAGHPLGHLVQDAVGLHHETPDGGGYPHQLRLEDIPIDARIIGVCDAFDAMTSTQPYRAGMPVDQALAIIELRLGVQFDRTAGQHFIALGRAGALAHIVGHSDEGIPLHECPMCGPTLVIRKHQQAGTHVYCPSCTSEFITTQADHGLITTPTGRKGTPRQLEPEADMALIQSLVRESARAVANVQ